MVEQTCREERQPVDLLERKRGLAAVLRAWVEDGNLHRLRLAAIQPHAKSIFLQGTDQLTVLVLSFYTKEPKTMSDPIPLETPGGFAPGVAVGFDDGNGKLAFASHSQPLPTLQVPPAVPTALEGETAATVRAGPFVPTALAPVFCTLSGEWQGCVRLLRSTDGGASFHPLTAGGAGWGIFTGNVCEVVWQESERAASLWVDCTIDSGTLTYRIAQ